MKRRDFVLSCLFVTAGSVLARIGPSLKLGSCQAKDLPVLTGQSPIPEKRSGIIETVQSSRVTLTRSSNNSIRLNNVESVIWRNIDGKNSCNHIVEHLSHKFGMDSRKAERDVDRFVHNLEKEGFLSLSKMSPCYARKARYGKKSL